MDRPDAEEPNSEPPSKESRSGDEPTAADLAELFDPQPDRVAELVRTALADTSTELALPDDPPASGVSIETALSLVTPYVRGAGRNLADAGFLAHMDPPTPSISWVMALLAASSNQNLLHPDTAPAARQLEQTVVSWLSDRFSMGGGHLVPGSTVANLTALWAARDLTGADTVVASADSHLSIRKAAAILGLDYVAIEPNGDNADRRHRRSISNDDLAGHDLEHAALVLTAGTTSIGAIDSLESGRTGPPPAWVHVDAAWAGPLHFSDRHRHRVAGIERADSIAVSAHKWLYQPKESAVVLFGDVAAANDAISVDGAYLKVPNVGLLGSHGAAAAPLAATLLHLGFDGLAALIDHGMAIADHLVERIEAEPELELYGPNVSGVVVWRHVDHDADHLQSELDGGFVSTTTIEGEPWLRSVAANPLAKPDLVVDAVLAAARRL